MTNRIILASLFTVALVAGGPAQAAEDRNQPKCTFHIFSDVNDHWALTEGSNKRKWLVMNVGESPVFVMGSEKTTIPYPDHQEVIGSGKSTIAAMKYGQPTVSLASENTKTTVVVCRFYERK